MKVSPARAAAFDVLLRIEKDRAMSSALLPIFEERLSDADKALCHELVLGILRRQMQLDGVTDGLSGGRKLDIEVRIALRLGLYQLLHLERIPTYSAINESVNLAQRAKKTSAKGFVNALLRRAMDTKIKTPPDDEITRVSIEGSHPRWLVERWAKALGITEATRLALANNATPPTAFRIINSKGNGVDDLLKISTASAHVPGCFLVRGAAKLLQELRAVGAIYLQDEASQLVAQAARSCDGGRFLDVCAAPGGKTSMIASRETDIKLIVAGDISTRRVELLRSSTISQGADRVHVLQYDAEESLPFEEGTFDLVLVDAPCSGTGTIRHNPEIRYSVAEEDLGKLQKKQMRILENSAATVRPGGELIYSTCSLEPEENEDVCEEFLSSGNDFEKIKPFVPERFRTPQGYARTWPHRDDMDGFFIAAFRRRG